MRGRILLMGGAATGGAAGAVLGAELGILGAALGGGLGYLLQEGIEYVIGPNFKLKTTLEPRIVGSIPTDVSRFIGRQTVLKKLHEFLQNDGSGVCTLYGLGGCGKSAVLKMFGIKEGFFSSKSTNKKISAVFSWSFSQDDDLDRFFSEIFIYLSPLLPDEEEESNSKRSPLLLPDIFESISGKVILILDGLERVVDERSSRNTQRGSVSTPALRALLQRASEQHGGDLKIFVTTRLLIPELAASQQKNSLIIDLNQMEETDAIALLRRCGARGTKRQLEQAADEFQYHAYSLFLLGIALFEEFRGDIRRRDRLYEFSTSDGDSPMSRILSWYLQTLEKYMLAYLKAASLFRGAVSCSTVNALLEPVSAQDPEHDSSWPPSKINSARRRLERLGLLFQSDQPSLSDDTINLHPIVREYFYGLLTDPTSLHEIAYEILSGTVTSPKPEDSASVARLIEMIYHTIKAGQYEEAWEIYRDRLGGYHNIGYSRADHPSGTKAIFLFLDEEKSEDVPVPDSVLLTLHVDGSLYLKNEGRMDDAIDLLENASNLKELLKEDPAQYISMLLVKSGTEFLRGRISQAIKSTSTGYEEFQHYRESFDVQTSDRIEKECYSRYATALAVSDSPEALKFFQKATEVPNHSKTVPHDHLPIRFGWYMTLRGRYDCAREILSKGLEHPKKIGAKMLVRRVQAMIALNEIESGQVAVAQDICRELTSWETKTDLHMFVLSWLIRAKLEYALRNIDTAVRLAERGREFAGENGFTLEWHDFTLLLAKIKYEKKQFSAAADLSKKILVGTEHDYTYIIPGADEDAINYVWTALPAKYMLAVSSQIQSKHNSEDDKDEALIKMTNMAHPFTSWLQATSIDD